MAEALDMDTSFEEMTGHPDIQEIDETGDELLRAVEVTGSAVVAKAELLPQEEEPFGLFEDHGPMQGDILSSSNVLTATPGDTKADPHDPR